MKKKPIALLVAAGLPAACLAFLGRHESLDVHPGNHALVMHDSVWAQIVAPEYDPERHTKTYKPYIALLAPQGGAPITKGLGGIDTHHRGLYLGWNKVEVDGRTYDFWHMKGVSQRHTGYTRKDATNATQHIEWCGPAGETILREARSVRIAEGEDGRRVFDFASILETESKRVQLKGDPHHAGMHARMANEVCFHPWSTKFVLPEDAKPKPDSRVEDAWWVCASVRVDGRRYWLFHATHPGSMPAPPEYSARKYGRFGAFWESEVTPEKPLYCRFRIVVATKPLDRDTCEALYAQYTRAR